ncbi:WD repeat-containing protein 20 isoform X4 [Odontomachus brunneus]|uniref:WD repeat-containing protein 20 isoform X4 n=1 Tax=Odontomachus brunneus TaxID=486640 RepID=UPI0013F204A2|nr:WD repeat-containing protein 20 isoform X4 [Odontomachus brunneus]
MAVQLDGGGKEDLKTQFVTREGTYKLMTLSEYSRPNRVGYTNSQGSASVRVSFVTLPDPADPTGAQGLGDRMCFNFGKELYVYVYRGVKKRLIDKSKVTCIKWVPGSNNLFLVSHSSGQLYLYNEELLCGTTAPHYQSFKSGDGYAIYTCKTKSTRNPLYRWVIGAEGCCINEFAFSPCGTNLAVVSQDGFLRVFQYNTMELVGSARSYFGGFLCVCWSPDGRYVVVGGEDDLVTIWSFHEKRVVARGQGHHSWVSVVAFDPYTTSYGDHDPDFSGSDDETMPHNNHNHFHEKSNRLSTTSQSGGVHSNRNSCSSELRMSGGTCYRLGSVSQDTQLCLWDITEDVLRQPVCAKQRPSVAGGSGALSASGTFNSGNGTTTATATGTGTATTAAATTANHHSNNAKHNNSNNVNSKESVSGNNETSNNSTSTNAAVATVNSLTQRLAGLGFGERKGDNHKRNFSLTMRGATGTATAATANSTIVQNSGGDKTTSNNANASSSLNSVGGAGLVGGANKKVSSVMDDPMRLIGTAWCPRFDECPVLEPLVCKKLAHERLTELVFREDCFVTACQDGYVYTWARPGHMVGPLTISSTLHRPHHHHSNSPYTNMNSLRPNDL